MTRRAWTEAERQLLADMYPHCHTADVAAWLDRGVQHCYAMAQRIGIAKAEEFLSSPLSGRLQPGQVTERMVAGRFQQGMKPWNKGQHYQAGGRSVATQFKPGQRGSNWKPVGTYRVNAEGYLDRKVTATGYPPADWKAVHRLVWEEAHGPVPDGHVVVFKAGQRTNVLEELTLDRLECISRAENARRNHPNNRCPEYARLVQLKGAITRQVNRIAREAAQKEPA